MLPYFVFSKLIEKIKYNLSNNKDIYMEKVIFIKEYKTDISMQLDPMNNEIAWKFLDVD